MNKKIIQSKQALRHALISLMESKDIHEITVAEVCRKADINRTTFYKYFSIPLDILSEYVDEISKEALQSIKQIIDPSSEIQLFESLLEICEIYNDNQAVMKMYLKFNQTLQVIMQQIFGTYAGKEFEESSLTYFIAGGVSSIIVQWSLNDYRQSPEEIATILTAYIVQLHS
ncbi:TetR/AcrR family transcriptional regulator [Paenibacillus sp. YIM B09110]|uniref:TetR/AcrR family transcriptional regulator n=1 Tax=Paenibacillus sp. YIM B09110 TaxID=3126102 RepID=UPI00301D28CE